MRQFMQLLVLLMLVPGWVSAGVNRDAVVRLDQDLTPVGAERQGNGSDIPGWSGGLPRQAGPWPEGFHPDPFASEMPVLRISAANLEKHRERLSAGQIALLQRFPDFYLNIYSSHRSASYPPSVYDALRHNAANTRLLPYGAGVDGAIMTSPFPMPTSGIEAIWNHTLRYRGETVSFRSVTSLITENGDRMDTLRDYRYFFKYSQPGMTQEKLDNTVFYLIRETLAPAQLAGTLTLVHEPMDQIRAPRKSWIYVAGQRRLRRTPDLAYDTPDASTQALRTVDQVDIFNGAPDRFDWHLLGKQEMYIPYNAYPVHQGGITLDTILQNQHPNPALLRYEAHRVWIVEARLREGVGHKYSRRRYYLDEDSWQIVYAEEYDQKDQLQQVLEAHLINYYDVPMMYPTLEVTYDLSSGRYYVEGLDNEQDAAPDFFTNGIRESDFSTNAVRRDARR